MSDNTNTADQAVSNVKHVASAAWAWLTVHPVALAVLSLLVGFLLG